MADSLDIQGFQKPDGAITSFFGGDYVDPYFATKSLLIADDAGMDVKVPLHSWINWALKRQTADGLFGRYKMNGNGGWDTVSSSDADDSMLALWLELLYSNTPTAELSSQWKKSIVKAENQLERLFDTEKGIYHISLDIPVGLLMDNSEIYSAFMKISQHLMQKNESEKSAFYRSKAERLRGAINRVFLTNNPKEFIVSTQENNHGNDFYPVKAAQLFPVIHQVLSDMDSTAAYKEWIKDNASQWLTQKTEDYPWGIFAVLSLSMNDNDSAACWRSNAEPMRYSKHWNILEEVSLQIVKSHLEHNSYSAHYIPCVKGRFS